MGLGLLVREGAAVDHTLHGIPSDLDAVGKPFTHKAAVPVSVHVTFVQGTWAHDDERQASLTVRGRPPALAHG